jgi:hypothetical protein
MKLKFFSLRESTELPVPALCTVVYTTIQSLPSSTKVKNVWSITSTSPYSDWLWAGRSGDRIPVEATFFAHVHSSPGVHPASCTMVTGLFLGVKRPGCGADYPPLLALRSRECRAIPLPSLWTFESVTGYFYLFATFPYAFMVQELPLPVPYYYFNYSNQ